MHRRRFLAGAAGVGALSLSGCAAGPVASLTGPERLDGPETESEDGELDLTYTDGETRTLSLAAQYGYSDRTGSIRLRISAWHRKGTTLDSLDLRLRAPASGVDPVTGVYLKTPFPGPGPSVTFETAQDGVGKHLSIPDLGFYGSGTFTLDFEIDPASMPDRFPVALAQSYTLSEEGTFGTVYSAKSTDVIEIARTA